MKSELANAPNESAATAINADAASAQADFIRRLREQFEELSGENATIRRMNDDYMTQIRKADDTLQQVTAKHYDQMAAARTETEGLRSTINATADASQGLLDEQERLASQVVQLRAEIIARNATNEQLTILTEQLREANTTVNIRMNELVQEANERLNGMFDQAAMQDVVREHEREVATAKVAYDHHIAELTVMVGDLQADNTQLSEDIGWYQEKYQETDEESDADGVEPPNQHTRFAPVDQNPAPQGAPGLSTLNANAPAFQAGSNLLEEVAKRLATLAGGAEEKVPVRKELDAVKVPSWPSIATYRDWTTQLTRNVNTTANRFDDTAIGWLHQTLKVDTNFDEFYECPKEFLTLDRCSHRTPGRSSTRFASP